MKSKNTHSEITEWRIKIIPFCGSGAMIKTNWGALLGALLFVAGLFGAIIVKALFLVSVFGLVLALVCLLFQGRIARRGWQKVVAQCTDREWKNIPSAASRNGGVRKTWIFQLLCEFELDGKRYTVTPGYWSTFLSESRLQKFLDKVISPDGECLLWINPENPLQTELIANDIRDFLLH